MNIRAEVDLARRELAFRGLSSLSAGDVGVMSVRGIDAADVDSLKLSVYRKDRATKVAEFTGFSVADGHRLVREVEFDFSGEAFSGWVDDEGPGDSEAYVIIEDEDTTWCACLVPFILRPLSSP